MHCSADLRNAVGDLSRVQQQASSSGRGLPAASLLGASRGLHAGFGQGRGHLEANMAAALALQSPQEYKRWLATYASHLAGQSSHLLALSFGLFQSHACLAHLTSWQNIRHPMHGLGKWFLTCPAVCYTVESKVHGSYRIQSAIVQKA